MAANGKVKKGNRVLVNVAFVNGPNGSGAIATSASLPDPDYGFNSGVRLVVERLNISVSGIMPQVNILSDTTLALVHGPIYTGCTTAGSSFNVSLFDPDGICAGVENEGLIVSGAFGTGVASGSCNAAYRIEEYFGSSTNTLP